MLQNQPSTTQFYEEKRVSLPTRYAFTAHKSFKMSCVLYEILTQGASEVPEFKFWAFQTFLIN